MNRMRATFSFTLFLLILAFPGMVSGAAARAAKKAEASGPVFPLEPEFQLELPGRPMERVYRDEASLYVSTKEGSVLAFDTSTREIRWRFDTGGPPVRGLLLAGSSLYFYDGGGNVYCLHSGDGKLLWSASLEGKPMGPLVEAAGMLLAVTEGGVVQAFGAGDGSKAWFFQAGEPIATGILPWRRNGLFFVFGSEGKKIFIVEKAGRLVSSREYESRILPSSLCLEGDRIYFAAEDGTIRCLDLLSFKTKWKARISGTVCAPPVVDRHHVYCVTRHSVLYCLKKKSGEISWWKGVTSRGSYEPLLVGDQVLWAGLSPSLKSLGIEDGQERGTYEARGEIQAGPIWIRPWLILSLYDFESGKGSLVFLKTKEKAEKEEAGPSKKTKAEPKPPRKKKRGEER